jgi:hypothetical protein
MAESERGTVGWSAFQTDTLQHGLGVIDGRLTTQPQAVYHTKWEGQLHLLTFDPATAVETEPEMYDK